METIKMVKTKKIEIIILVLVCFIIYFSFFTQTHGCFNQDANENVYWIEKGLFFHGARHFGYKLLGVLFYGFWKMFGWDKGGIIPLQFLSSIFGAFGVGSFYLILRKLFKNKTIYLFFPLFLAFSHAYWFYSIEAIARIPSLFFGLMALYFLFDIDKKKSNGVYMVSLMHALSIILDLSSFLFIPIIAVGFYLFSDRKRNGLKLIFKYFSMLMLFILPVYIFLFIVQRGSFSLIKFVEFMTYKTPPSGGNIKLVLYSIVQNIINVKYQILFELLYLRKIVFLIGFIFVCLIVTLFLKMRNSSNFHKNLLIFCIIWILFPLPFYYYQQPYCLEYYINLLIPFWIIMSTIFYYLIKDVGFKSRVIYNVVIVFSLILFFCYNFYFSIYPKSKIKNGEFYPHYKFIKQTSNRFSADNTMLIVYGFIGAPELAVYEIDKVLNGINIKIIPIGDMGSDIRTLMFYEKLKYEMLNYENVMIYFILCSKEKYLFQKLKKKTKSKIIDGKEISKDFISTLADFTTVAGNRKKRISRFRYLLDALNKDYSFRLKFSEDADVILLFATRSS